MRIFFFCCISLLSVSLLAQENEFHPVASANFNVIKAQADSFFAIPSNRPAFSADGETEDNDFLRYKRWEYYWSSRVMPDGSFPDMNAQAAAYSQFNHSTQNQHVINPLQWTNISQTYADGGYNGMGRATAIAFDPVDSNIFYVGAPIGGIWKTIDGGQSYSPLGDSLPYVSAGNILVDFRNPSTLYITVGDDQGWWQYGLGVYKSTDGGTTWNATTHTTQFVTGIAYYSMVMSPQAPDTILLAQSDGLYRTADGGATWTLVHNGAFRDVKFRPGDGTVAYAASDDYWGSSEVYKSTDGGITWNAISSFGQNYNSIHISTTPANADRLGISCDYSGNMKYYVSADAGSTINFRSDLPQDAIIYLSPTDTTLVYCGSLMVYGSSDGGTTWNQMTMWYNDGVHPTVHADEHFVAFNPANGCSYFCNDGGLYRLRESDFTWTELNNGFVTTQFYKISVSQQNPVFMLGGTQDNGGRKRIGVNTWAPTNGGDAMDNAVDETNDNTIYTTYIYGKLYRSYDQWNNDIYFDITPSGSRGSWVTPYLLDPNDQNKIVAAYQDVYTSPDQGATWNRISTNITGDTNNTLGCIAVAKFNSDVIYTSWTNKIYSTHDAGATWQQYSTPVLTSNFGGISSISVFPGTTDVVYITSGGYVNGKKVYKSVNGGASWTNISGSLPNIPVNCGIFNRMSFYHDYYIGTDIGVFMMNDTMTTWMYYGTGLPNTSVSDLEIQYASGKLRAGTFGRGIWEINIDGTTAVPENPLELSSDFSLTMNPVHDALYLDAHLRTDAHTVFTICDISGKEITATETHTPIGNYQMTFDVTGLASGIYLVRAEEKNGKSAVFKFVKQ